MRDKKFGWLNDHDKLFSTLELSFNRSLNAEEIFYYIYAIFYSNIYREKYQEFLRSDFPRIPFTSDYQTFQNLAILGEQLVELHLLKSKLLDHPSSRYEGKGDNRVEKHEFIQLSKNKIQNGSEFPKPPFGKTGIVAINDKQYFDNVSLEVWNYYIGGYQVLDKWLKDRKSRVLSLEDQLHFRKIITALAHTLDIQKKINKVYPDVEKSLDKEVKE